MQSMVLLWQVVCPSNTEVWSHWLE